MVRFSIPDENERKQIWEKSFPVNSEFDNIPNQVKKYELPGGSIINAIHYAGIQAVKKRHKLLTRETHPVLEMTGNGYQQEETDHPNKLKFYLEDVTEGIRREMFKEGRPFAG